MDPEQVEMIPLKDAAEAILFVILEISGQDNARLTTDCFSGAVGMMTIENISMADIARKHGVTREAVRKRIELYQDGLGIIGSVFQKRSQVGETYRKCNYRNHKN